MLNDKEILQQWADIIVKEMQSVSKSFAPSFESVITETQHGINLSVLAHKYIGVLIDGRRPTKIGAPKGNPTLQQIILKWIKDKGITPRANKNGKVPTIESFSWAVSKSIHLYGTRLYQKGGGNNVFDRIITTERVEALFNQFGENYYKNIESDLINSIRKR